MWFGVNESAKYWLEVLNEIKNQDIDDIMIISFDGLTGFGDAISTVFQKLRYSDVWSIKFAIQQSSFHTKISNHL